MFNRLLNRFQPKVELVVLTNKQTIMSGFHAEFMTEVYLTLWPFDSEDEFHWEFRTNTKDNTQIELVLNSTEKRYRKVVEALRSKGIDLQYNKALKAAELVEYVEES